MNTQQTSTHYKAIIDALLLSLPRLSVRGYGGYGKKPLPYSQESSFPETQSNLYSPASEKAFWECCKFLKDAKTTKTLRRYSPSSYGLKEVVERLTYNETGKTIYVPEGIFLAAAHYMKSRIGLKIQTSDGQNGAVFNIKA